MDQIATNGIEINPSDPLTPTEDTPVEISESIITNSIFPCGALCQELPEEIERELNEDPDLKAYSIDVIRSWILESKEFYGRTDESFILRFLRICKFNLEMSKQRMLRYYSTRHKYANYFDRSEENVKMVEKLMAQRFAYSMNYAGNSEENVYIITGAIGLSNLGKIPLEKAVCTTLGLISEICFEDPRVQVHGVHYIFDYTGMTMELLIQFTPALIWRLVTMMTVSAPIKVRGIHMLNTPSFVNKVLSITRFFLTKKLRSRFYIHKNLESLHDQISTECLPLELGGSAGPMQTFIDSSILMFRNAGDVNEKNKHYGIGKFPQE